jgi:addiction module HigA family antidote
LGLSANALARELHTPSNPITEIMNGQRGITLDTALRLARYFGTTPELQQAHDLSRLGLSLVLASPMR